jgi:hypothetical protein
MIIIAKIFLSLPFILPISGVRNAPSKGIATINAGE